jgi:phosphate transport system substrate-binding protein
MTERNSHLTSTRWRFGGRKTINRSRRRLPLIAVVAIASVLAVPAVAGATTLVGSGSSAAQPYMEALFTAYNKLHKNIKFLYNADGGNAGVTDVQQGKSEFAIQTAPPVPADSGTIFDKLFLDALCIDVNKSQSTSNLTVGTLKSIFTGVDTSWSQVGGSGGTIDPIGRTPTAGQYTFFKSSVLGSSTQSSNVAALASDGLVAQKIETDSNAIGYVGLANSAHKGEKALEVNGVPCTAKYVKNKTYPLFRYDWAVLPKGKSNAQVGAFFDWVRLSAAAGKIINKAGAVAAFNQ